MAEKDVTVFLCDICKQQFNRSDAVIVHKNAVHFKIKPFKCEICDEENLGVKYAQSIANQKVI